MPLSTPEEIDGEQSEETEPSDEPDLEEAVEPQDDPEDVPEGVDGSPDGDDQDRIEELEEIVSEQQEVIDGLHERLSVLDEHIQERVETVQEEIDQLDGWSDRTVEAVNELIGASNRLKTAVFGGEYPCPECDGLLELKHGGMVAQDKIECDDCGFSEELA